MCACARVWALTAACLMGRAWGMYQSAQGKGKSTLFGMLFKSSSSSFLRTPDITVKHLSLQESCTFHSRFVAKPGGNTGHQSIRQKLQMLHMAPNLLKFYNWKGEQTKRDNQTAPRPPKDAVHSLHRPSKSWSSFIAVVCLDELRLLTVTKEEAHSWHQRLCLN